MRGFLIHSTDDGRVPAFEYLPAEGLVPKIGMALCMADGTLSMAGATVAPQYISMCEKESACGEGEEIPVVRVGTDIIFGTESEEDMAAVNVGDKVTLSADAMGVTATTASGVAEVVGKDEEGVRVRFA